jgi:hypothetical protein
VKAPNILPFVVLMIMIVAPFPTKADKIELKEKPSLNDL